MSCTDHVCQRGPRPKHLPWLIMAWVLTASSNFSKLWRRIVALSFGSSTRGVLAAGIAVAEVAAVTVISQLQGSFVARRGDSLAGVSAWNGRQDQRSVW